MMPYIRIEPAITSACLSSFEGNQFKALSGLEKYLMSIK